MMSEKIVLNAVPDNKPFYALHFSGWQLFRTNPNCDMKGKRLSLLLGASDSLKRIDFQRLVETREKKKEEMHWFNLCGATILVSAQILNYSTILNK